jgi:hypothetical protein
MSGSTNLQQWNPTGANQESDSAYTVDAQRTGGAANPSIFTSATANKLFYQLSTFLAAFGQALSAKGYTISDANLSTLAGVLANVVTEVDLAAALALYAPLASPSLTGTPTAPTQAASDNSTHVATTAYVISAIASGLYNCSFPLVTTNNIVVNTLANLVKAITNTPPSGDSTTTVPNTSWVSTYFAPFSAFAFSNSAGAGYQKLPYGLILQWGSGSAPTGNGDLVNFTLAFPNACFQVVANDAGAGPASSCNPLTPQVYSASQMRVYARSIATNTYATSNFDWIAVGN